MNCIPGIAIIVPGFSLTVTSGRMTIPCVVRLCGIEAKKETHMSKTNQLRCAVAMASLLTAARIGRAQLYTWTGADGNGWNDPSNWTVGGVYMGSAPPGDGDVYFPITAAPTVGACSYFTNTANFSVGGPGVGGLTVSASAINYGSIIINGPYGTFNVHGLLDNFGSILNTENSYFSIYGSVINSGAINGGLSIWNNQGVQTSTLTGGGTINLSGNLSGPSQTLEGDIFANQNNTIQGSGYILGETNFANSGLIVANVMGGTLQVDMVGSNKGTMQATNGGILFFSNARGTVDNTGGVIQALAASTVSLSGTISNGVITSFGSGVVLGSGSECTLNNVTNSGTIIIPVNSTFISFVINGLNNTGTVTVAGNVNSANSYADVAFNYPAFAGQTSTLTGGGSVQLSSSNSFLIANYNGGCLVNANNLIHGAGSISTCDGPSFVNQGTISADISGQQLSVIVGGSSAASYVNTGTIQATGGGILAIGASVNNTGGVIQALNGSTVTFNGGTVAGGTLSVFGSGLLQLPSGTTAISALTGTGTATVAVTTSLTVASIQLGGLSVAGKVTVPVGSASISVLTSLSIANNGAALGTRTYSGFMDLGDNDLILHGVTEANARDMVRAWYHGGTHTTTGLGSSLAGTGTGANAVAALAVITNSDGQGGSLFTTFDGVSVSATDVLVKYTYFGDTNLDGVVDGSDLANLLAGMNGHLTGWVNGDMNYDGVVNSVDLTLLLSGLRGQGAPLGDNGSGGVQGIVPEPSAMVSILAVVPLLARRRR